jgi:hypothetical protein
MSGKNVGGGSIFLKILIVVLIGVLYIAVDLPSRQWKKQAADLKEARLRMQNLNTATLQYLFFNRRFPHELRRDPLKSGYLHPQDASHLVHCR